MTKSYKELVSSVVQVGELFSLKQTQIIDLLVETKSLWFNGHFELLSERHSDSFFRFALITEYPHQVSKISEELLGWIRNPKTDLGQIDVVLSTSRAGSLLAYDIARGLSSSSPRIRAVYADCDDSTGYPIDLQEGFAIERNERVLVVNDLTTTGKALQGLINLAESYSAKVAGVCVFAAREENIIKIERIKKKYKFHSIVNINFQSWAKHECPLCAEGKPFVYSKDLNSWVLKTPITEILAPLKDLITGEEEVANSDKVASFK